MNICISFVVYKVSKELKRLLQERNATRSVNEAIEVPDLIHQVTINLLERVKTIRTALLLTDEQRYLAQIFDFGY